MRDASTGAKGTYIEYAEVLAHTSVNVDDIESFFICV
jgi:hypothetical protein